MASPVIPEATSPHRKTCLQVLPALVTGGVERGTVDVAQALAQAGWRALVVSSGGPTCSTRLTPWLERHAADLGRTYLSELSIHFDKEQTHG